MITNDITLIHGDCLEEMQKLPDNSVDLVVCDLPYETLNKGNKSSQWDKALPMDELWKQYKRIVKDNGAIILFAQGMFTARIMLSNETMWRYNLIWKKGNRSTGFLNAKKMPLRNHEDICVFYKKLPTYNPQFTKGEPIHGRKTHHKDGDFKNRCYGTFNMTEPVITDDKYPVSVLDFPKEWKDWYHPTQKPVELLKWLIKTYSNEGETVLDNTAGSMSTGIAALETNRKCICIEKDDKFFRIGEERIDNWINENKTMNELNGKEWFDENECISSKEIAEKDNYVLVEFENKHGEIEGLLKSQIEKHFPDVVIKEECEYLLKDKGSDEYLDEMPDLFCSE